LRREKRSLGKREGAKADPRKVSAGGGCGSMGLNGGKMF